MPVAEIIDTLQQIAPLHFAESWDNVGLLAGSPAWQARRVLLTIDLTQSVLQEAIEAEADLIVAYHPPIFEGFKRLTDADPKQRLVMEAIASHIAIYSPHTALDAAPGGLNDWLAEGVGAGDVRAMQAFEDIPEGEQCKIITFCPPDAVDRIRNGLASAGAGRIGEYQLCSFQSLGRGTFLGGENSNPAVGRKGQVEHVEEVRLEMVCSQAALGLATIALREFHPYEEPAFDIIPLHPRPLRGTGAGRRVMLDQPVALKTLVARVKRQLGVEQVQVATSDDSPGRIERVCLCAGAGGSLLATAIAQGAQMYLTGEMRHHDVLHAQASGVTVVLAGHTNTERGYLRVLKRRLQASHQDVEMIVSRRDTEPLRLM